MNGFTVIIICD